MTDTTFIQFRDALNKRFNKLAEAGNLYQSHTNKDDLWDLYLASYPEGTNPIFRERTTHDCQCCKRFIRNVGRVVGNINGELSTIFGDLSVTGEYAVVAEALDALVKQGTIATIYLNDEQIVGQRENFELLDDGSSHQWDHFYQVLPQKAYSLGSDVGTRKGKAQTNCKVLKRSITELTEYSVDVVEDLILQGSIHRGDEFKGIILGLKKLQQGYNEAPNKDLFLWDATLEMQKNQHDCNIRGTAIGTLLVDLSNDVELEVAVKKYEDKVSGTNYKRTTALATPKMKEEAKAKAKELGIEPSFLRRMSNKTDLSVNDVLFADNSVKEFMEDSIFDSVDTNKPTKSKSLDKVESMTAEDFITKVLPKADTIEVLLENKHESNLMSLVSPVNPTAPCIMKWGNNNSWSYNGEVAESVTKQRVKAAGGITDAPLRISLSWNKRDDLDLHLREPNGGHVYYSSKNGRTGCRLDVDMQGEVLNQVENIYWTDLNKLVTGNYEVAVHNYSLNPSRSGEKEELGFTLEVEHEGDVITMFHPVNLRNKETVKAINFSVNSKGEITFKPLIKGDNSINSKTVWGVETEEFHKVDMVMRSPNYWESSNKTGNEHLFFILDKCVNPESVRGFYNEFLSQELQPYRKVFETLASQLKAEYSEDQLSGVGFSTTKRAEVTLRIKGSFNRIIKVTF